MDGGLSGGINDTLDAIDQQLLALIHENPRLTVSKMATLLSTSQRVAERRIANLKSTHLRRIGSRKTGHWEVINPPSPKTRIS
jgi:predicted HTH transcriptional regulator